MNLLCRYRRRAAAAASASRAYALARRRLFSVRPQSLPHRAAAVRGGLAQLGLRAPWPRVLIKSRGSPPRDCAFARGSLSLAAASAACPAGAAAALRLVSCGSYRGNRHGEKKSGAEPKACAGPERWPRVGGGRAGGAAPGTLSPAPSLSEASLAPPAGEPTSDGRTIVRPGGLATDVRGHASGGQPGVSLRF